MLDFCTLFDSRYLSRGLAMIRSLRAVSPRARIYAAAFDQGCRRALERLGPEGVEIIGLEELEDAELLAAKPTRSRAEYCWTCTPSLIRYCLKRWGLADCTYLDADLAFYADPAVLDRELGPASIGITPHRYEPAFDQSAESGIYCVQFVYFRNDRRGLEALEWWRAACNAWCYARHEDGKFGDQKYLDDWPVRFEGVKVIEHPGAGAAPWNIGRYRLVEAGDGLLLEDRLSNAKGRLVFYHFHELKFLVRGLAELARYPLPAEVKRRLYRPYLALNAETAAAVAGVDPDLDPLGRAERAELWKLPVRMLKRLIRGNFNYGWLWRTS